MAQLRIYSVITNGPMSVVGVIVGAFGIHRTVLVNFNDGGRKYGRTWNVTHILTGHRIQCFHKRSDAIRLAKLLTSPCWTSQLWRFGGDVDKSLRASKDYRVAKAEAKAALATFDTKSLAP